LGATALDKVDMTTEACHGSHAHGLDAHRTLTHDATQCGGTR
jgi:hypothetical protein